MKIIHYIAVAAAMLISSTVWAGEATVTTTTASGVQAVAPNVNTSPAVAKTAVNANDTAIRNATVSTATTTTGTR